MSAHPYLTLIKFRNHVTFVNVLFGAFLFAQEPDWRLVAELAALYLSFNVLMYGGIYTLNDLADLEADRMHSAKRLRPIASGAVDPRAAWRFGILMILAGLVTAVPLFPMGIVACYLAVLAVNAAYSLGGRNIRYVDIVLNSVPHVIRFLMGVLLVDRRPPATHLVTLLLFACAMSFLRRSVEREHPGWAARQTLHGYGRQELRIGAWLCCSALFVMAGFFARDAPGFYVAVIVSALVLIVGGHYVALVRKPLAVIWTR